MKKFNLTVLGLSLIALTCCNNKDKNNSISSLNGKSETLELDKSKEVSKYDINVAINSIPQNISDADILEYPKDNLESIVSAKLAQEEKSLNTPNEDGTIYSIGSASTIIPSNKNGFITSRNIAFSKAVLNAKLNILRLTGELITSEKQYGILEKISSGVDPDANSKASLLQKIGILADKSIDEALRYLGVNDFEIAKLNEEEKEKLFEDSFMKEVSSFTSSMLKGISIVKITEGEIGDNDYQIAVCVKYNPNYNSFANIADLQASNSALNSSRMDYLREVDEGLLIPRLGSQIFIDGSTKTKFLVGFGQSSIRKSDRRQSSIEDIAFNKSRLQAIENIKDFIAEDLTANEIFQQIEKYTEFQDGTESLYTSDNFSKFISSNRSSITLNTLELRRWKASHPVSGELIAGSIVVLTESTQLGRAEDQSNKAENNTKKSEYITNETLEGEEF